MSSSSDLQLEQTHYDHILLGTGLTNAIVASALAKAEKSVLHIDPRGEYGSGLASHSLDAFVDFVRSHAAPLAEEAEGERPPTDEQIRQWREVTKDEEGKLEFQLVRQRTPFFDAQWTDYTLQQAEAEAEAARTAAAAAAAAAEATAKQATAAESDAVTGSDTSAASSSSSPAPAPSVAAKPAVSSLHSQSRRFSIDLSPHLLFARSPLIDLLVTSGIHHYVEFKAVDHAYFAQPTAAAAAAAKANAAGPALSLLPLSKSAIFQSSSLSMLEKRLLMKFLHLALGDDYHQPLEAENPKQAAAGSTGPALPEAQRSQPFGDFLAAQKLSPQLRQMVLYAVALLDESANDVARVTASVGMERLRAYLSSVGRYGPGAFLYPNYGISELPQAFARLCAVNRGVYILRFQPVAIVYERQASGAVPSSETAEDGQAAGESSAAPPARVYKGVLTHGGQLLTSTSLIAESDYQHPADASSASSPAAAAAIAPHFITRCLLIVDGPLRAGAASDSLAPSSFFSLAPDSATDSPIYGLQLGAEVGATPKGHSLVHLFTTGTSLDQAQRNATRLRDLATTVTRPLAHQPDGEAVDELKPRLLALASYQQRVMRPAVTPGVPAFAEASAASGADADVDTSAAAAPVASPIFTSSPGASVALSLDECLADAASLFTRLHPSLVFRDCMRAAPSGATDDEDMALLQQIDGAHTNQQGQEGDEDDAEAPSATTTAAEGDAVSAPVSDVTDAQPAASSSAASAADSLPASSPAAATSAETGDAEQSTA